MVRCGAIPQLTPLPLAPRKSTAGFGSDDSVLEAEAGVGDRVGVVVEAADCVFSCGVWWM